MRMFSKKSEKTQKMNQTKNIIQNTHKTFSIFLLLVCIAFNLTNAETSTQSWKKQKRREKILKMYTEVRRK